jgi:EpsI family protein
MTARLLVVSACLLLASAMLGRASKSESVPLRAPLAAFPLDIANWKGQAAAPFEPQVLRVLAVDDYLNRVYVARPNHVAALYIGYYQSQREGDTIHSPLNCLPGAGWQPMSRDRISIDSIPAPVNQLVIQKGLDRQIVVYWYQSHGRVVASEYWGRAFLALDALRLNRTDGAMVRIVAPVDDREPSGEITAERTAQDFTRSIFPLLSRYLPG